MDFVGKDGYGLRYKIIDGPFERSNQVQKLMITHNFRLVLGLADDIVKRLDTDSDGGTSRILISWSKPGVAEGLHVL